MSLRILVVDDHADAADSLAELLSIMGHEVQAAYDGQAAIQIVAEFKPALVLLDLAMPGLDGYAVARRLRASGANCIIAAVTGCGHQADVERCLSEGFDRHLLKPAAPSDVRELVQFALKAEHSRQS